MKVFSLLVLVLVVSCLEPKETNQNGQEDTTKINQDTSGFMDGKRTFLALGDSYTIGESVPEEERWPVQLVNRLNDQLKKKLAQPQIVARTGWTTDELQAGINNTSLHPPYDLVSLLIGVNNQYRGYPVDQYQKEFKELLEQALVFSGNKSQHVFVVSIPDYGVTPFAQERGLSEEEIAREIDLYNEIAKDISGEYQVSYFDITQISRKAKNDPGMIAADGLHPSGEMYSEWVDLILPWAVEILDE